MAGRATAGGRSSGTRAAGTTRGTTRKPAARKPAARRSSGRRTRRKPDLLDRAIDGVGRGVARAGRGVGRGIGRTRDIDPVHRRGGLGVLVLVLAVVVGAGVWAGAGGPVGQTFSSALGRDRRARRGGRSRAAVRRRRGAHDHRGRTPRPGRGWWSARRSSRSARSASCTSAAGLPAEPERWREGGGAVGYLAAIPLASGLTVWVAVPVLLLLSGYAVLLLIDTPLREVPDLFRRLTGRALADEDEHDADRRTTDGHDLEDDAAPAEPARRRPSRRRQGAFAEPSAAAEPPAEPDAPPAATGEPPARPRRPAPPVPATPPAETGGDGVGEQLRLAMRETAGDTTYTLPPSDLLPTGPAAAHPQQRERRRSSRRSPASSSSSTSTRRSPASPAARPSPATRSSWARRSRSRRSPSCTATSPTRSPPTTSACSRRSPASRRSASRCPTPTARWSGSATCCAAAPRAASSTRWCIGLGKDIEGHFLVREPGEDAAPARRRVHRLRQVELRQLDARLAAVAGHAGRGPDDPHRPEDGRADPVRGHPAPDHAHHHPAEEGGGRAGLAGRGDGAALPGHAGQQGPPRRRLQPQGPRRARSPRRPAASGSTGPTPTSCASSTSWPT